MHATLDDPKVSRIAAAAAKGRINVAIGCWALDNCINATSDCPGVGCAKQYANTIIIFDRDGIIVGTYEKTHAATGGPPYFWPPGQVGWTWIDFLFGLALCALVSCVARVS